MQCFRSAPRKCIFRGSAPRAAAASAVAALKLELACALIASNHYKILVWKAVRRFGRQRFFLVLACSCEPRPACSVSVDILLRVKVFVCASASVSLLVSAAVANKLKEGSKNQELTPTLDGPK